MLSRGKKKQLGRNDIDDIGAPRKPVCDCRHYMFTRRADMHSFIRHFDEPVANRLRGTGNGKSSFPNTGNAQKPVPKPVLSGARHLFDEAVLRQRNHQTPLGRLVQVGKARQSAKSLEWIMKRSRVRGSSLRGYDHAVFSGIHCVFYHRYHLVWSTKYGDKALLGDIRLGVREICRQPCREKGAEIIRGALSSDHVHTFVSVPPKLAVSDLLRLMKGRSSHKVRCEFPQLKRRYQGFRFWGRGYFSTTNRAITEGIVLQHLEHHIANPTGTSRTVV